MATAHLTESDVRVRDAVMRQLEWHPLVEASAIGVAANGGAVTLTGYTDSYSSKLAAERAAKHIRGVRAVANDIEVKGMVGRTDADIASDAARALELHSMVPEGVKATVHSGHVTLTGRVTWLCQKNDAERAIRHIRGVLGIINYISVTVRPVPQDVRRRIVKALHHEADVNARGIVVNVTGNTALLTGSVESLLQREAAERAAAHAPGISHVDNRLAVEPTAQEIAEDLDEIC